jgi:hypothetical protein
VKGGDMPPYISSQGEQIMSKLSGNIENEGMLDLTWAQTEDDLKSITSLTNIGLVRVPVHLLGYFSSIPRTNVGLIYPVKHGPKKEMTGQVRLTGEFLAKGDPETTLMISGQFIVMPPVESVGFKDITVIGQLILPRGSEGIISSKLGEVIGQVFYVSWDKGTPRFFLGSDSIGKAFLELVESVPWIIAGSVNIEDDVTVEMLRSKVPEIVLIGSLTAPRALLPILQVLTTEKAGSIDAKEDLADEKED